jgi:hypothetical protein
LFSTNQHRHPPYRSSTQTFKDCDFKTVPTVIFVDEEKKPVPLLWPKLKTLAVRLQKSRAKHIHRNKLAEAQLQSQQPRYNRHSMSPARRATPKTKTSTSHAILYFGAGCVSGMNAHTRAMRVT